MFEILVLTVVVILAFVAAGWYAYQHSQQRKRTSDIDLDLDDYFKSEDDYAERFDRIFEHELEQQIIDQTTADIESEPMVTLSSQSYNEVTIETEEPEISQRSTTEDTFISSQDDLAETTTNIIDDPDQQAIAPHDWDMVVAFTIVAPESARFSGKAIKNALEALDLKFGDMQIYHRFSNSTRKQTLFSVANLIDPGTLMPDSFATMTTPGLLIFAKLPGPVNGLTLFDDLLDAAIKMTERLGGVLCDDKREPISQATLETMRSHILDLNLTIQTEKNQYSNDYSD